MMIIEVINSLANKLGLLIILVFFLSRIGVFKKLILKEHISNYERLLLMLIFGGLGIVGTYYGIPVMGSIANSRIIAVMIAGILGGPAVGFGAGLIAGFHRWAIDIGGFTAFSCGFSTVIQGMIGGYIHSKFRNKMIDIWDPLIAVVLAEVLEMFFILIFATPFGEAVELVKIIFFPMLAINSIGMAVSILIINNIYSEQEKVAAMNAQLALNIANKTLPYLRKGLNSISAMKTTKIIHEMAKIDGISITDTKKVLSFSGNISINLLANKPIEDLSILEVMKTGERAIVTRRNFDGNYYTSIVVPLKDRNLIVGSLILYRMGKGSIGTLDVELAMGLAQLSSTQLELSKIEEQARLLSKAELKALQAQINPHFLFNALNTIISYCRVSPETARKLLIDLGDIFRSNLNHWGENIDLIAEIENIKSYLNIEKARFGDRLNVNFNIEEDVNCNIPPLLLQPLVENAIKHGLLPKEEGGAITIGARKCLEGTYIFVKDDGVGFMPEELFLEKDANKKIGLNNIDKRLKNLYGLENGLSIESEPGKGTTASMIIPHYSGNRGMIYEDESINCG